jgi:hypothetical protein
MKHYTARFIVAVLTFVTGIALASFWLITRNEQIKPNKSTVSIEQHALSDSLITFERTGEGCNGACPVYSVTIFADRTVVFNGQRYWHPGDKPSEFKSPGLIRSSINEEQLQQLISEFEKADYFSLNDSYEKGGCPRFTGDMPNIYTSIQISGRSKRIKHNWGCIEKDNDLTIYPQKLYKLEMKIDEIVNTKQWMP